MLTQCELVESKVSLTLNASDGVHRVSAERLRGGRMRLDCSCRESSRHGWCLHRVRLLCLHYNDIVGCSQDEALRFEELVTGTPLAETADEVDLALTDYETARKALASVPAPFEGGGLRTISARAADLAEAARQLDRAVERLKRRLAGAA